VHHTVQVLSTTAEKDDDIFVCDKQKYHIYSATVLYYKEKFKRILYSFMHKDKNVCFF
jgi:hypothetical protein